MSKRADARDALTEIWNKPRSQKSRPKPDVSEQPERSNANPLDLMSDVMAGIGAPTGATQGNEIQMLDPNILDDSPFRDRMDVDSDPELEGLTETIRAAGQQVPILVRPHPEIPDRYQIAYGHRRKRACLQLDRYVRAIVKNLSDDELIVAQAIENRERKDLTFIEKCLFVSTLKQRGVTRALIAKALGSAGTKNAVNYYTTAEDIPEYVLRKIGPAPSIKGPKWQTLAAHFKAKELPSKKQKALDALLQSEAWAALTSDGRFSALLKELNKCDRTQSTATAEKSTWEGPSANLAADIQRSKAGLQLKFRTAEAQDFGAYVANNLDRLFAEYQSGKETKD